MPAQACGKQQVTEAQRERVESVHYGVRKKRKRNWVWEENGRDY